MAGGLSFKQGVDTGRKANLFKPSALRPQG